MKNSIELKTMYCALERLNFINRFNAAYLHIEMANHPEIYDPTTGGFCYGCSKECKKEDIPEINKKRCAFFFMFNTMTGNSLVRRRLDGTPTEMQILMGDTPEELGGCGSDFVVDFLFGFTGYEYKKITDPLKFKEEIIKSINENKPVIARLKPEACEVINYDSYKIENFTVNGKPMGLKLEYETANSPKPKDDAYYSKEDFDDCVYLTDKVIGSGTHIISYEFTPTRPEKAGPINGAVGLAAPGMAVGKYPDLAMVVAINKDTSNFQAYNHDNFVESEPSIKVEVGKKYIITIEVTTGSPAVYSVWVTPEGGEKVQIAKDFKQRQTAAPLESIGQLCLRDGNSSDNVRPEKFMLISGYDGDNLIVPHYVKNPHDSGNIIEQPPMYGDIESLIVFGKKGERRYTSKDGFANMLRVSNYSLTEKIWEEYVSKLGGFGKFESEDGMDNASPQEMKFRAKQVYNMPMYLYNYCSLQGALKAEKTEGQYLHEELFDPKCAYFQDRIIKHWIFVSQGHNVYELNKHKIWREENKEKVAELCIDICETYTKIRKAEVSMNGLLNKLCTYMDMNEEERQAFMLKVESRKKPKK